jgi:hypothetical protein
MPVPAEVVCAYWDARRKTGLTATLSKAFGRLVMLFELTPEQQEIVFKLRSETYV